MSKPSKYDDAFAALALLCAQYPNCFARFQDPRRPLKIGIHKDIPDGLIEPKVLARAFRLYVNNPLYLNAMRLGVARVDLNGEPAGTVDEKDAKARLAGIRKVKQDGKHHEEAAKVAPPPAPARRDSLSELREAARTRRGAA